MNKDKQQNYDKNKSKVIIGNFKPDLLNNIQRPPLVRHIIQSNQTNPLYNKLIKLTHAELANPLIDYKSFTKYRPEDLI